MQKPETFAQRDPERCAPAVFGGKRALGHAALAAILGMALTSEALASTIYAVINDIEESPAYAAYFTSLGIAPSARIVATVTYDPSNRSVSQDGRVSNTQPISVTLNFGTTSLDLPIAQGSSPGQLDRITVEDNATNPSFSGRDSVTVSSVTDLELGGNLYLGDTFFQRRSHEKQDVFGGIDLPTVDVINTLPNANFVSSIFRREQDASGNIVAAPLVGRISSTSVTFTDTFPTSVPTPPTVLLFTLGFGWIAGAHGLAAARGRRFGTPSPS